jgi:hypothetical protein
MSGFAIFQNDATNISITESVFRDPSFSQGFNSFYETGSGFSARKFVWAGDTHLDIVTPVANLVGAMYTGYVGMNSFLNSELSISSLIALASKTHVQRGEFNLTSSLSNNVLGASTVPRITTVGTLQPPDLKNAYSYLGAEKIAYVVLQSASQSISTTTDRNYSLIGNCCGDFGFYPSGNDAFLYNMFRINPYVIGRSVLEDVPYLPLMVPSKPPVDQPSLVKFIKTLELTTCETTAQQESLAIEAPLLTRTLSVDSENSELVHYGLSHFMEVPIEVEIERFLYDNKVDVRILKSVIKMRESAPLQFAPLISSGLHFLSAVAPVALNYVKENKLGRDTMTKVVGKRLTNFLYGEGSTVQRDAVNQLVSLMSNIRNIRGRPRIRKKVAKEEAKVIELNDRPRRNRRRRKRKNNSALVPVNPAV